MKTFILSRLKCKNGNRFFLRLDLRYENKEQSYPSTHNGVTTFAIKCLVLCERLTKNASVYCRIISHFMTALQKGSYYHQQLLLMLAGANMIFQSDTCSLKAIRRRSQRLLCPSRQLAEPL